MEKKKKEKKNRYLIYNYSLHFSSLFKVKVYISTDGAMSYSLILSVL